MRSRLNTIILGCAVALFAFSSCKKDNIDLPQANDPVFTVDGSLGGEIFSLVAGDNNAYMHTMTDLVNGVKFYKGVLSDGNISLEFGIYDGHVDIPGHIPVDEMQSINVQFAKHQSEPLVILTKEMLNNTQNIESIDWYVNNVFSGTNEAYIMQPGKYNVCALIEFVNGQTGNLCDEIIIGYTRSANCSIDFYSQMGNLNASINSIGSGVDHINWFLDDVPVSSSLNLQQTLDSSLHVLKAEVHFTNGVVRTKSALVDGMYGMNTVHDFSIFEMISSPGVSVEQDYNVKIRLEMDGKVYRSEWADNSNSSLTIVGIEYYGKNANNKDVYKVFGIVDAVVMETVSEKMIPISFNTVFGVEIP